MLNSSAARIGLIAVLCLPSVGFAQYREARDSSVASTIARLRRDASIPEVAADLLRQRRGPVSRQKRRELADSLVEFIVSARGESVGAAFALMGLGWGGYPREKPTDLPDLEVLDRLIEIDRRLNGTWRSEILDYIFGQDRPIRGLEYLRSIATSVMNTSAITAVNSMKTMALRPETAPERNEARKHLREMWDADLVLYAPARAELACLARALDWPKRGTRCPIA